MNAALADQRAFDAASVDPFADERLHAGWRAAAEWLLLLSALIGLMLLGMALLPSRSLSAAESNLLITAIILGLYRWALHAVCLGRALWFLHLAYPRLRARAARAEDASSPSHVYFLITSFRIDPLITGRVCKALLDEAVSCNAPATIVASIVEHGDELLIKALWKQRNPPARLHLKIVRMPGAGKRDGMAAGLRAISRDSPDSRALIAVIDGNSVLLPGVIRKCAQMFHLLPGVGVISTNAFCSVHGGRLLREWHRMRYAQRHLNLCSMALGHRVLNPGSSLLLFRAEVATGPSFIADIEQNASLHWRLGRLGFRPGDDPSSCFSVLRHGWSSAYLPDAAIHRHEPSSDLSFIDASCRLMFRWHANSRRQSGRMLRLGPRKLGWYVWYLLQDRRVQTWAGLLGLCAAVLAGIHHSYVFLLGYLVWVGVSRFLMCLMLTAGGHPITPLYPLLMGYDQIAGSMIKVFVQCFPDRPSSSERLQAARPGDRFHRLFNDWSSRIMLFTALSLLSAVVTVIVLMKPRYG